LYCIATGEANQTREYFCYREKKYLKIPEALVDKNHFAVLYRYNDCCMQNSGHLWILMARSLNDEATIQEKEELNNILRQDESLQQQYDLLDRIWSDKTARLNNESENSSVTKAISKIITLAELEKIQFDDDDAPKNRKFVRRRRILLTSLALLIIASAGFIWIYTSSSSAIVQKAGETIAVQNGSRSRSMLPDGTTVWLNAGSKLFYDDNFSGATREVRLEGEAFFDVVKQPQRPFIVHTSGIDIKVLGTAFNVKSYPEDKTVITTLYRGSVKIFRENESEKFAIILKPNEKVILSKDAAKADNHLSLKNNNNTAPQLIPASYIRTYIDSTKKENEQLETAWLYSRLEFRGDSFEELARKMEHWFNVKIVFEDENLKQLNFNGSFEKETLEEALIALKTTIPFNYKIKGHEIFISSYQ
jgi:ferric-dicitrate binding protein FerR (iron transport regulator)